MWNIAKPAAVAALLLAAIQIGCWRTVIGSRSPDGQHQVRVREWCIPPDCGIKAQVGPAFWPETIGQINDAYLVFAPVAWSADSSRVAIIVANGYGSPIKAGYDTTAKRQLPFEAVSAFLGESIRRSYSPSAADLADYEGDAVRCAEHSALVRERYRLLHVPKAELNHDAER